ncbi:MAG: NCS2 family permease [Bacilli bacterium]|jgi:AGZA family xanthine/uracil permease-like MFS transporter|nr:NCS2 family permease [Bacilli bacterium]MCI2054624.1 NCS2 family permease [Bacilli bacterium]
MSESQVVEKPENKFLSFFHVRERGSKPSNEILGGLVTFLAMCYILPVNASILGSTGMNSLGVFASTAIVSAIVTLIMGLVANCPIALSAGMGLNAYLAYTVCGALGYSWQEALILLTITGIVFFIFSLTPIRRKIIEAFPEGLQSIISAGLGCFIAFVGLKGSGIIVASSGTLVTLGSLSDPAVLLSIGGILLVVILMNIRTKKGILSSLAVPLGMLSVALIGVIIRACGVDNANLPWADFSTNWGINGFTDVFLYGLLSDGQQNVVTGSAFWGLVADVFSKPASYVIIFSLIFVNLFDTTATLMAIGRGTTIFGADGKMKDNRAIVADATGALICAPMGTATVTSFVESTIGVKIGARTGLASVVTGSLFLLSAFIYPVFQLFTYSCVSCAALVVVGSMIFASNLKSLHWDEAEIGFSAFITILMIVLTYSLTNGIGFGLIFYCVIMLARGKGKQVSWILYLISGAYLLSFALNEVLTKLA